MVVNSLRFVVLVDNVVLICRCTLNDVCNGL